MSTQNQFVRKTITVSIACCLLAGLAAAQDVSSAAQSTSDPAKDQASFERAAAGRWIEVFADSCTGDWKEKWRLDGEVGTVSTGPGGMTLSAGPEDGNDAHHMVLWTKDSFEGDVKIEYDVTRLDTARNRVTILYIQATGSGAGPYAKDISQWNELRRVPAMRVYFNHMNTYHISYAANPGTEQAYIRGRRYLPEGQGLQGTQLRPDYSAPGLFATGVKHHITVIKQDRDLYMRVENPDQVAYFHMTNAELPAITEGRIGLRHMYTRSSRYANFRVSVPGPALAQDPPAREPLSARAASIAPLDGPVQVGKPVTFRGSSNPGDAHWDLGDGTTAAGALATHTYQEPGIYRVVMGSKTGDTFNEKASAIVRVHRPETLHLPQVLLDTDAHNEVDDQHYIGYALFSNLDILAINSVHNGPWRKEQGGTESEAINYQEIRNLLDLSRRSGLPDHRSEREIPQAYHGAADKLEVPASGKWFDTQPIQTEASEAILAAARGASPDNPVWVLPVGPCTNIASAMLQAREEGLDLTQRIKVCWLGGGPERANGRSFNGQNDPWSVYVTAKSGIEFWILLENPTGASIRFNGPDDYGLYPGNPLGDYLEADMREYMENRNINSKALYDLGCVSMVIGNHLEKSWLTSVEPSRVLGPDQQYRWKRVDGPSNVRIIRNIDEEAMKTDFFHTLNGKPAELKAKR